jgi:hypothetical protein
MKWSDRTHLDVTYNGHASVWVQVVKYGGVNISLRDLSGKSERDSEGGRGKATPWKGTS